MDFRKSSGLLQKSIDSGIEKIHFNTVIFIQQASKQRENSDRPFNDDGMPDPASENVN